MTFISGALVRHDDDCNAMDVSNETIPTKNLEIPSIADAAASWGTKLDKKQFIAFKVLCCSFFLSIVINGTESNSELAQFLSTSLNCNCIEERDKVIEKLEANGGEKNLAMFITGPARCGKSICIELAHKYCHKFCQVTGLPFDDMTFYFTSTAGSSAALFGGMTIYSAAHLNRKKITDDICTE